MILEKPAIYTDLYELTMAQGYYLSGRHTQPASFDYFFRKLPFDGGYVVFAGLADFLQSLEDFEFHPEELEYLKSQGFTDDFINYLRDFQFTGDIFSVKEGEIIFPNEPVLRVEGSILETQILETLLLNTLNFESLIATKAARIKQAAGDKPVVDFGLRRAQGLGGLQASKAAVIGGFQGTSNVLAGMKYDIAISGTMAHSWIQSFEDELTAFRTYAEHYPDSSILLVDTYSTLDIGVPNAIKVAKELEEKGHQLKAIRLDSGDLAYFGRKSREMLNEAGLDYVKIAVSNQLDEHLIKSLLDQDAPIDLFGVGTKLVTAYDNPALDGVYKLSSVNERPTLKISENVEKITLPGAKRVVRYLNDDDEFYRDGILLTDEKDINKVVHPYIDFKFTHTSSLKKEELQQQVVENGKRLIDLPKASESAAYAQKRLSQLPREFKRFDNPHIYKVGLSPNLRKLKDELIQQKDS